MSTAPRVNIVYVRGTVRRLLPFLENLLGHTTWRFRIVANGCTAEERELMRAAAAAAGDRIELRVVSTDTVLLHGTVLEWLVRDEPSPYFCCVDSDIFAMQPVAIEEMLPGDGEVATCSGLPMWRIEQDDVMPHGFQVASGRFLRTLRGDFLGCTYVCCYRTDELRATLARWQVPLTPSRWERLPAPVRDELDRRGLRFGSYDTLTVANILLQTPERPMVYREIKALRHLGAQSSLAENVAMLRRPFRALAWRFFPSFFRVLWRARGLSVAESASMADFARRRSEALRLTDALVAGRARFESAPAWVDGVEEFEELASLLGPDRDGERDG